MKKSFKIISALVLSSTMAFGLGATIFASSNSVSKTEAYYSPSTHYEVSNTASKLASYYSSITDSMTGSTLLSALQSLNSSKRQKTIGYSAMGTAASSSCYVYTDYDPNYTTTDGNGQTYGTKVLSFYTKTSSTDWNREHVWPNSHGGGSKGSATGTMVDQDVYMPRPTISSENSSRGNSYYVEGMNHSSNGWDPKTAGYAEWVRGECARIILYCVVANTSLSLNNNTSSSTPDAAMGKMETLIKWHYAYSPSEYEINRNNGGQYLQGNRNPFVDHPEYVSRIWGVSSGPTGASSTIASQVNNASSTYDSWVAGSGSTYGTNDALGGTSTNSITISSSGKTMTVGDTDTLYATSSDSSNITWTTSNSSVVSLNKTTTGSGSSNTVTLTAVAAGTATITAKATIGGNQYTKTCAVTVNAAGSQQGATAGSIVPADLATAYETNSSGTAHTSSDGNIGFKTYQCANYSSKIQWKKSTSAFLYSTTSLNLSSITINGMSGGALTVYGGTSAGSKGTAITGSNGTYNLSGYNYFYIENGSSSAATATSIDVQTQSTTKTLSSIAVKTAPTKTTYTAGEYFAPAGLVITATYSDNSHEDISYASNSSSFTFNPSTSTALTTSNTSVTITYGGKSCSQAITVNAAATPTVNSVTVSPSTLSLAVNGTSTLTATVSVSNGAAQTVTWSSSNTNVATVNSSGKVTAVAAGTATITATSTVDSSKKGTCAVTVTSGGTTTTTYNKVTSESDLTSGQYLIVYETDSLAFNGALSSLDATSNTISVTISNNAITRSSATEASEFTIDTSAGTILSASGKYIGNESNSNSLTSSSTALTNTITYNNGDIDVVSSGGAYLRYNTTDGQTRFRYYKSSSYTNQQAIQFYKLSGSVAKTLSSIAVSGAQTNYTTGDTFVKPTVTATFSDNSQVDVTNTATFSGYDMSVAGSQTVTVSYTYGSVTKETTYTITVTQGSTPVTTYEQVTGSLSAGDKVVIVAQANRSSNSGYAMTSSVINSYYFDKVDASISNQKLNYTSDMAVWTVGGSSSAGFTFYNETEAKYFYGYTTTSSGKTYRDLGLTTDTTHTGTKWTVSANAAGSGYDMTTTHNSNTIYLEYYTSKSNWSAYTASATDVVINFYKETTASSTNGATTFATAFLAAITCDSTGTNAPTFTSGNSWSSLATQYAALTSTEKQTLQNANANASGTVIEQAMARYDYIVAKYGEAQYSNFIGRTISNSANRMNSFNSDSTNNLLLVLGSISLLGGLTYLAYFLKKRKED